MGRTYRFDKQQKQSFQPVEEIVCRCGSPKCTWCESARQFAGAYANTRHTPSKSDQWPTDDFEEWDA